ncbi:MerR family transcriptional regulator [Hahella sp. KA22]|uniref:MerR family transcriptional regulator n=1 Tax=Hahella sp. KA22 TaxID=1628392 RepID=UPI000FDE3C02|nr:MerR family transcriptional regulator [Hahella sp. KA22]AZZ94913.1 MerR family transcriptional regulator [Hahella sp. KA22]QAY52557.1 MerR family transcriptional regulator [Hahella sp. KA22]
MYTIGQMARKFGVSRSTLLYYDSIGLLSPSARSEANYRLYSEADFSRMEKIAFYREAGLPLENIADVLAQPHDGVQDILEQRLQSINREIQRLRAQQQVIASILKSERGRKKSRIIDKQGWVAMLAAVGLDEAAMRQWHVEFESMSPEAHQDFLESLGIPAEEIKTIRHWSRNGG